MLGLPSRRKRRRLVVLRASPSVLRRRPFGENRSAIPVDPKINPDNSAAFFATHNRKNRRAKPEALQTERPGLMALR